VRKFFLNGSLIGTTPLRRDDLNPGEATYLLALEGHLPREIKASLDPKQVFKQEVPLTQVAPLYTGIIHVKYGGQCQCAVGHHARLRSQIGHDGPKQQVWRRGRQI